MAEKLFICKKGWRRHSKGTIINEWEWKKLAIESRESYFEEYVDPNPVKPVESHAPKEKVPATPVETISVTEPWVSVGTSVSSIASRKFNLDESND